MDPIPCQPGTSCAGANTVTHAGLHLAGVVRNMNIADLHVGTSQRASGRTPLCLYWDCFALNVIHPTVSCLASANWHPGMPKFKATVSRQKSRKLDSKICHYDSTDVLLSSHSDAFGSHRTSSSQGRQRPCSGVWEQLLTCGSQYCNAVSKSLKCFCVTTFSLSD